MKAFLSELQLNAVQIDKISAVFTEKIYLKNGDYFVKEGQIANSLGFVVKGACRYFYTTGKGDDITRWVALENEFTTSLSSFITGKPSVENIQAIKNTEILLVSKANWLKLYEENEFVRTIWTKRMEEEYIGMENRVALFITQNAEERFQWLLSFRPDFILHVPDKYLATILGITPRHISRLLNGKRGQMSS